MLQLLMDSLTIPVLAALADCVHCSIASLGSSCPAVHILPTAIGRSQIITQIKESGLLRCGDGLGQAPVLSFIIVMV